MRNLLFRCAFDGRNYHGYQVQKNAVTVMETLQNGIEKIIGKRDGIVGCSRTDSGVHAREYYFNMHTGSTVPPERFVRALNRVLPKDIVILDCREVPETFHARYSALGKQYIYRLYDGKLRNPFYEGFAYHYKRSVDVDLLNRAAAHFCGTHDFVGFSNTGTDVEDTVRTLSEFSVRRNGDFVEFSVTGDGFLYNMVRVLVGTLLKVNEGKLQIDELDDLIASKNRQRAGQTAPACGLYLTRVFYPNEE